MSAPFAATAARLSVTVSAETSSTDPQAVAGKVAPIPAAQQTQDRKLTIGSTTRCPQSIQVVEQQYVNTYTYNANGTVAFRNNFGIVNQSWQTIYEASRQFEMMHRLQQERASAPIPTRDPFGNPIPPQPRFVPADYSAAITWARCHVGEVQREATNKAAIEQTAQPRLQPPGITPSQGSETNTAGQMHSGSARDMDPANTQNSVGRSNAGADGQRTNSQSARAVKFQSQDATTCVEIVPKGFKCDAMHDRFMTNICRTKISVRWRLGSDGWSQTDLAPAACSPLSPWKDDRTVQYKACSWDPKANYGPYSDPCRY